MTQPVFQAFLVDQIWMLLVLYYDAIVINCGPLIWMLLLL